MRHHIDLKPVTHTSKTAVKVAKGTATSHKFKCAALFLLFFLVASPSNGQLTSWKTSLVSSSQGELATFWNVREAGLREDFSGTTGYLDILNTSGVPLTGAVFYAEYFDADGRFCFSLVFSQDKNPVEQTPIAPGEARVIGSVASGLFPSVEPKEVRLYMVRLKLSDQRNSLRKWDVAFRAPVTLTTGVEVTVYLGSEARSAKGYASDLLLATVGVDKDGTVTSVDVLHAASSDVESWFRDYARRQAMFYPATNGGEPLQSRALVLVRAVAEGGGGQKPLLPPRTSPWVVSYVRSSSDTTFLPVISIAFTRPGTKLNKLRPGGGDMEVIERPPAPPGMFELSFQDSYWSSPIFTWVSDATMPHHLRREFAVGESK